MEPTGGNNLLPQSVACKRRSVVAGSKRPGAAAGRRIVQLVEPGGCMESKDAHVVADSGPVVAGRSEASGTGSSVVAARTLAALDHVGQVVACPLPAAGAASACGAYRPASVVPDYRVAHIGHLVHPQNHHTFEHPRQFRSFADRTVARRL